MPRPKTHDDALRRRLLERAGELLSTEGPAAVSLRKIATDVNTSTTAVYSLFGGKPALLEALYDEAFTRFGRNLAAVPVTDDPAEDLLRIGLAYRRSALEDPQFYSVLYSKVVAPTKEMSRAAGRTFAPVINAVRRAVEQGVYLAEDPEQIAMSMWGIAHGLVSLELNGNLPPGVDAAATYELALRAHGRGWRAEAGKTL
ncbi:MULTISPECIES: TetR/AcrR family transcriptional regulator [Lentzea]|uniref:DNA-binding transcriptional regulator, AcrR family n=1 Tax=Lentzea jiangxiensis TaxID=641025 RepID=A0A1H0ENU0_9PSEU|nr:MULTISPECIES: TetR/AcrR family transcriptional regulator [Lentzea]MCG8920982.1 TetR/AcrR family transcriptional regulator [Lentzea sp. CC55]WVH79650.1 TetR/AcrR family transcriptional regulator [Lentzea sp. DG1S-22]SDN84005.1 DNA-binding transcriptional regulator, AcrR family [Lentzea jiangxiensis]